MNLYTNKVCLKHFSTMVHKDLLPGKSVLFLLVFTLLSYAPQASAQTVRGVVEDIYTGQPVSDAHIRMNGSAIGTVSSPDGLFTLNGFSSLTDTLWISKVGYRSAKLAIAGTAVEEQMLSTIRLLPEIIQLNEEVIVTVQRMPQAQFESPFPVSVLNAAQLIQYAPRSMAEALEGLPGVWMQKTNHGGGSPFVRGLTGNQTLLMIDGIRLNNAIARYGPNQYFNTIDPNSVERVEVVRGSGSVQYGSDALGGVVQVLTKTPTLNPEGWRVQGNLYGKYMSGDMERSGRGELTVSHPRLALYGGLSFRNFGDLIAGGRRVLAPSGYREASVVSKAVVKLTKRQQLTAAYQRLQQNDVHRWDQVTQRGYALWKFDPQIRHLGYLRWEGQTGNRWTKTIRATTSLNRSVEERVTQRADSPIRRHERDAVNTYGAQFEVVSEPSASYRLVTGIEYYADRIYSKVFEEDIAAETQSAQRSTYPEGAQASSWALFSLHTWWLDRWTLNYGVRGGQVRVSAQDETFGALNNSPNTWVGNLGISYALHPHYRVVTSVSTGFRAPNVDDLTKFGSFDSGFEVPIRDLAPERSVTVEAGMKNKTDYFSGTLMVYHTRLSNLIERASARYQGSEQWQGDPVFQKQNVAAAFLRGVEAEAAWQINTIWTAFGSLMYTYGKNVTANEPMRRIPPLHGRAGFQWENALGFSARAEWRYAGAQRRLSEGDVNDHRIADGGTNDWQIVNLYAGYARAQWAMNVGLQNILDARYRTHGSGVNGYGRSAWLAVRWGFKTKKPERVRL